MPIKIIYYSQVIDNYGRTESSMKGDYIFNALMCSEEWSDDMTFEGENGQIYFIDDLIDKEVSVPEIGVFTVPNHGE